MTQDTHNPSTPSRSSSDSLAGRIFGDVPFVVIAVVLLVAGLGIRAAAEKFRLHFRKLPVYMQQSLDAFAREDLGRYRIIDMDPDTKEIDTIKIPDDVIEELGTDMYLQAVVEDTQLPNNDPTRLMTLFVTYYTGDPDQVPHVPDVCYVGGGHESVSAENLVVSVPGIGQNSDKLPIRVLEFTQGKFLGGVKPVMYFFSVNGGYTETRAGARKALADIRERYAYFSKVEVAFADRSRQPDKQQAVQACERLLQVVVPLLHEKYWPDWEAVQAGTYSHLGGEPTAPETSEK